MATTESTARLARKVKKHEEDIRVHGDEIDEILQILKGHTADLARIDLKVTEIDAKVDGVDGTLALIDSRVDKIEGGQTTLRLNVDNLRSDVKTVDGRLVRVERSLSRHGELLEEVLRRLGAGVD